MASEGPLRRSTMSQEAHPVRESMRGSITINEELPLREVLKCIIVLLCQHIMWKHT